MSFFISNAMADAAAPAAAGPMGGGFKIRFRKEWEFESPSGHHLKKRP